MRAPGPPPGDSFSTPPLKKNKDLAVFLNKIFLKTKNLTALVSYCILPLSWRCPEATSMAALSRQNKGLNRESTGDVSLQDVMSGPATGRTGRGTWGSGMDGVVLSVLSEYLGTAAVPPGKSGMGCLCLPGRKGEAEGEKSRVGSDWESVPSTHPAHRRYGRKAFVSLR